MHGMHERITTDSQAFIDACFTEFPYKLSSREPFQMALYIQGVHNLTLYKASLRRGPVTEQEIVMGRDTRGQVIFVSTITGVSDELREALKAGRVPRNELAAYVQRTRINIPNFRGIDQKYFRALQKLVNERLIQTGQHIQAGTVEFRSNYDEPRDTSGPSETTQGGSILEFFGTSRPKMELDQSASGVEFNFSPLMDLRIKREIDKWLDRLEKTHKENNDASSPHNAA